MTDSERAYALIRKDKNFLNSLVHKFANLSTYPPADTPVTYFMAGAPGAGKTEWVESVVKLYRARAEPYFFVHIDPDKIRQEFPGYTGKNVSEFEHATSLAVGRLIDKTHKAGQDVIVDGTLSKMTVAERNIEDCLTRYKRPTAIFYVYQKPELAWHYTKARLVKDGRPVEKSAFINAYVKSMENVNILKRKYGSELSLYIIEKNEFNALKKSPFKVDNIDSNVEKVYTKEELERLIQ